MWMMICTNNVAVPELNVHKEQSQYWGKFRETSSDVCCFLSSFDIYAISNEEISTLFRTLNVFTVQRGYLGLHLTVSILFMVIFQICLCLCNLHWVWVSPFNKIKINREEMFSPLTVNMCLHGATEILNIFIKFYMQALMKSTGKDVYSEECLNCTCLPWWRAWYPWRDSELEIESDQKLLRKFISTKKIFQPYSTVIASMTTQHLEESCLTYLKRIGFLIWIFHYTR